MASRHGHSESSTATTEIQVSFEDAPPKPEVLRLTLRDKTSFWQRVRQATAQFTPGSLMEAISGERARIMANVRKRGYITEEEADILNKTTGEKLKKTLDDFYEKSMEELAIKSSDTFEEITFKTDFAEQLLKWLSDLFAWVLDKMKEIFKWVEENIEWCWEKTEELFKKLFSLLE